MQRELGVLDWIRLRQRLAHYRLAKPLSVAQLAVEIDVKESTIYRIENVKKDPTYKPRLQTVVDWLDHTDGPGLPAFFSEVENAASSDRMTYPVTPDRDTDRATPAVDTSGARTHGLDPLSSSDSVALADLRAFIATLAEALAAAASAHPTQYRSSADPADEEPAQGDVSG